MNIKIINKGNLPIPKYKTPGSAGLDLHANIENPVNIKPMEIKLIPTGISVSIPIGYEGQVRARSGLALNHGITLVNGIGTIDSDYRGEVKVILINLGDKEYTIEKGDRIAQLVIAKYEIIEFDLVEDLDETNRAYGGFGHTGA